MLTFDEVLSITNQEIEQINWSKEPKGLYEPIGYILSLGGKRLRPVITMMTCNLYSDDIAPSLKPALGVEIFHNFTLLHDDIMDRADVRRGKPTVHKKWSDNTAILSGDVMQIEAYKWVAETPEKYLKKVLNIFSQTAAEICEGQQLDMEFEKRNDVSIDEYIEMIRLKTAVLIACGCQMGAIIGGADDEDAQNLYDFGKWVGLAFQLKDDLLDVYGDEANFGKKIGGDILCNKKTFLLINALQLATGEDARLLEFWLLNNAKHLREEKIEQITAIYNRLKIRELCENKMQEFLNKGIESLKKVKASETKKAELYTLANKLMERND